jgi:hypothetical protein
MRSLLTACAPLAARIPIASTATLALILTGCSLFHREPAPTASTPSTPAEQQAECARLAAEIRTYQEKQRRAPTVSADEDIVRAAEAKADKGLEDLQAQYEDMDCSAAALPPTRARTPLLPPAPAPGGVLQ